MELVLSGRGKGAAIIAVVAVGLLASAIGMAALRRTTHRAAPIVYVCTETGEMVTLPPRSVPAVNPRTGKRTLVRGVYCSHCQRWYAAPPSDHRSGNPKILKCRVHGIEMTFDGPLATNSP